MTSGPSQSSESQTDETKAEQQQQQQAPLPPVRPIPTFTDTVLQHFPTMNKLHFRIATRRQPPFC
jgi:hypothetical protein